MKSNLTFGQVKKGTIGKIRQNQVTTKNAVIKNSNKNNAYAGKICLVILTSYKKDMVCLSYFN